MTQLRGATALITGATGGLGSAIATALRGEGCELVVTGRRREALDEVARRFGARAVVADLTVRSDLERLVVEAGDVDIVVANAAVPASGHLETWDQAEIDRALEVNLGGPIAMTRAFLDAFRQRGSGHFVYISSISGKLASPGTALYSATKFGLRGFSGGLRCDLQGSGVSASVVLPGFVRDAGMFADTGVKLLPGMGTVSPQAVAAGVVKAIRADRAEVTVASLPMRIGAFLGVLAPTMATTVQVRFGSDLSKRITEAQK